MVGALLNLFLESFAGRGLGCVMLLGLGLFPPHFSTIFLSVAFSFYTHREGLIQGVISFKKESPHGNSPHLPCLVPGGPRETCHGGPKGDPPGPSGQCSKERFCRRPVKVELILLALFILA